jgi:molybdopterin-guanine dinucleotide biosynthesis protein A
MKTGTGEGFVIAGGSGTRMGQPKAFLPFKGSTLLQNAVGILKRAELEVRIVASTAQGFDAGGVPVLIDAFPGAGPLGALYTALKNSKSPDCFVLACDLPLVTPDFFRLLKKAAPPFDAVIPLDGHGWPHLLAAYYSVSCLDPLEALLHQGKRKLREILNCDTLNVLRMQTTEKSLPDSLFLNVNTRDDYERLLDRSES